MSLDHDAIRASFPALKLRPDYIFADNAGGSQALQGVVDRVTDYLCNTNVQLGADYSIGKASTERVQQGIEAAAHLMNAASVNEVAFMPSSTMAIENLARALEADIKAGDEIIITQEHEANVGPWEKLAKRCGAVIKVWAPTHLSETAKSGQTNPYAIGLQIPCLLVLITARTRIVALTACSNILGSIMPVAEIVNAVRSEARIKGTLKVECCVDCVAYAPHRRMDVRAWDVDYAFFSFYKVYGPHNAVLYTRSQSLLALTSLAHHFLSVDHLPYKLQPGGGGYELTYASAAVLPYLISLTPSNTLEASFETIEKHEQSMLTHLLAYLSDQEQYDKGVRIVGSAKIGPTRAPTVSFVVQGKSSRSIVQHFDVAGNIGIRFGHFYAYTLVDTLAPKIDPNDGVVRISLAFYNTNKEVDRIVSLLRQVI